MCDQDFLLLVEDNTEVQQNNKKILERRGYNIEQALTLLEARNIISLRRPRAIILDIMLPDGSGLDFLAELRENTDIPVLLLTSLGTREDILAGLRAGGDDYLSKPYDLSIFLMRVEALLRRASRVPESIIKGSLLLKPASLVATLNGEDLTLSKKEFSLLMFFIQNQNRLMTAEYLYRNVWDAAMTGDGNVVKVTISKLRKKITGSGYTISAEYGEGYIFEKA